MLKLGSVGLLRALPLFMFQNRFYLVLISVLGIVISRLLCISQSDAKALIAFSSVVHMNFLLILILLMISISKILRILIILSHGLCSSFIFLFVGVYFYRVNRRKIYFISRLLKMNVMLIRLFIFVILTNIGVPPRLVFIVELLRVVSIIERFKILLFPLFLYILYRVYFSIYILVNIIRGKSLYYVKETSLVFRVSFISFFKLFFFRY